MEGKGLFSPQPPPRTTPGSRGPLSPSQFINGPAWESGAVSPPPAPEATPPCTPRIPGAVWPRPLGDAITGRPGGGGRIWRRGRCGRGWWGSACSPWHTRPSRQRSVSHRPGGVPGLRHSRTADRELPGRGPGRGGIIIVFSRESAGGGGPALGPGLRGERRFRDYRGARLVWAPQRPGREGKTKGGKGASAWLLPSRCLPTPRPASLPPP